VLLIDLTSQKSVRAAVVDIRASTSNCMCLITMLRYLPTSGRTEDVLEKHLLPLPVTFLLTHLLLDTLKGKAPLHGSSMWPQTFWDQTEFGTDLQTTKRIYSYMKGLGPTKLGLIMFTKSSLEGTVLPLSRSRSWQRAACLNDIPAFVRFILIG